MNYKTIKLYGSEINGELDGKIIHTQFIRTDSRDDDILYELILELPEPVNINKEDKK